MKLIKTKQTFKREERLRSSKIIKSLFSHGNTFLVHPFKVNWLTESEAATYPARVMIGISRKNFRNASDRNHLKRIVREAYRKNKHVLNTYLEGQNTSCNFSIIYIGKSKADYSVVEKKIIVLIKRLISELEVHLHQNNTKS